MLFGSRPELQQLILEMLTLEERDQLQIEIENWENLADV